MLGRTERDEGTCKWAKNADMVVPDLRCSANVFRAIKSRRQSGQDLRTCGRRNKYVCERLDLKVE
jgi:hypothetical protein